MRVGRVGSIMRAAVVGLAASILTVAVPSTAGAITDGSATTSGDVSSLPAVVRVHAESLWDTYDCTGTLVSPDWVLTAQHCTNKDGNQGKVFIPSDMTVRFQKGPRNVAFTRKVSQVHRMPNYGATGGDDVALLRLQTSVADVEPIAVLDGQFFPSVGQVVRFGYASGDLRSSAEGVRPTASVDFTKAGCKNAPYGCWYPDNSLWTYDEQRGWPATGDSGGPALLKLATGRYVLVGVTQGTIPNSLSSTPDIIGLSNRVDTGSRAWNFMRSVAPGLPVDRLVYPDGTLVKERSTVWVYVVFGGAKFLIPNAAAFDALGYSWSSIITTSDGALRDVPAVPQDGTVLREYSNPTVYRVENGRRRAISASEYARRGFGHLLHYVPDGGLAQVPVRA